MENQVIPNGLYIHFKGNHYRVIGEVLDSDTNTTKVLYQNVYGDFYSRSVESWLDVAYDHSGNIVERFRRVGN